MRPDRLAWKLVKTPPGCRQEAFAVIATEHARIGLAQPSRFFEHGVEYRCEITRRGIDDAQHLGGRRLLLKRLWHLSPDPSSSIGITAYAEQLRNRAMFLLEDRKSC